VVADLGATQKSLFSDSLRHTGSWAGAAFVMWPYVRR